MLTNFMLFELYRKIGVKICILVFISKKRALFGQSIDSDKIRLCPVYCYCDFFSGRGTQWKIARWADIRHYIKTTNYCFGYILYPPFIPIVLSRSPNLSGLFLWLRIFFLSVFLFIYCAHLFDGMSLLFSTKHRPTAIQILQTFCLQYLDDIYCYIASDSPRIASSTQ